MPMRAEKGSVFGAQVCAALGIDPETVCRVELLATPDKALTVMVTMYADAEQLKAARELIVAHIGRVVFKGIDLATGEEPTEEWEFAE